MHSRPHPRSYFRPSLCRLLALATALALLAGVPAEGEDGAGTAALPSPAAGPLLPLEYGAIVYQHNGHGPRQIFIIGQSHRSALTGQAAPDTVKVQAEVYRIGEWLIRERQVGLLLPEGFFQRTPPGDLPPADAARECSRLDSQTLEAELSDDRHFVNADLLLNASYHVQLGQVEDERLYRAIHRLLGEARRDDSLSLRSALDGLQDERTAVLLQNIPEVVEEAYRTGRISNRQAIFTVGLAHLGTIIELLQGGPAPDEALPVMKLLEQGYGVTVILPRTLAENRHSLRLCRLAID